MIEKNLHSLKLHYSDLYDILDMHQKEGLFKLEEINNNFNLSYQNKYIHSKYNPEIEAFRWVDGLDINEEDCIFIIGLGLGYYLDYLVTKYPDKKIIIVEPSQEIFMNFLSVKDITTYIENKNIVFLVEKDTNTIRSLFDYYVQNNKVKKIFYTELPVYKKIYEAYIKEVYYELKKVLLLLQGNLTTEILSSRRWLYNIIRNFKYIGTHNNMVCLENLFSGVPVVIVSAGPSLDKNMSLLKDIYNRALIIAVGTAASILDSNGIEPHIIMGVDGNPAESTIFKKLRNTNPLLIYAQMIHYEAIENYSGKKVWVHFTGDSILKYLFEKLNYDCPEILTGGSIANTALALAHWLKAGTILLIGQDLAYTNKKAYAAGSAHEEENLIVTESGYIETTDIYGNQIYTRSQFLTYKNWFEDYVKLKLKDIKIFNCTEGGLNIEGIPNLSFADAIDLYCNDIYDIERIIGNSLNEKSTLDEEFLNRKMDEYKKQLEEAIELSRKRLEKITEIIEKQIYDIDQYDENVDEILLLTSQIEDLEFFKVFIENTGKMYHEAITRSTNQQLEVTKESGERKKSVLHGLFTQYTFVHDNLIVAKGAFEEKEVAGVF